ncbi:MAG: hypothetical protein HFI72_01450 [Peptococcaceae bacterium]|jgi:hypothetical protein|nr:hypothetical protein [Peptococcaceae bacterium]
MEQRKPEKQLKQAKGATGSCSVRCYNVIFPVWFLLLFPIAWLYAMPANFIIDSIVLLLALHMLKVEEKGKIYKKTILGVWAFGFIADIVGAASLLLSQLELGEWWQNQVTMPVILNPWTSIPGFAMVFLSLVLAGGLIYFLNYKFLFSKLPQVGAKAKRLCLALAIITAPYLYLVPTDFLYHGWDAEYFDKEQQEDLSHDGENPDPAATDWVVADIVSSDEKQLVFTDQYGNYYLYGADKDKTLLQTVDGEITASLQEVLDQGKVTIQDLLTLGFDIKLQVVQ